MSRLPNGVRKRKNGTYEIRFTHNGKRHSEYGKTAQECVEKRDAIIDELKKGIIQKDVKISELYEHYKQINRNKKQSTKNTHENDYNRIILYLGDRVVRDITRADVLEFQRKLQQKYAPSTTNNSVTFLSTLCKVAIEERVMFYSPCYGVHNIPVPQDNKHARETIHRAFTIEEQQTFLAVAKDDWYYELYVFLLCTGMRVSEACALRWEDIDNGIIDISKTVTFDSDGKPVLGTPKTKTSKRVVPLATTAETTLERQRQKMRDWFGETEFVFCTKSKGGMSYEQLVNDYLASVVEDAGLEPFTSHAFRATFATRFLEQGGDPNVLKELMGHSSYKMTMDLYAHVLLDTKKKAMENYSIELG